MQRREGSLGGPVNGSDCPTIHSVTAAVPPVPSAAPAGASGRATLLLMIPLNLTLVAWLWVGRLVFGVFGWFALVLIPVVLIALVALLVTTVLALTQKRRPLGLSRAERRWQWTVWAALFIGGAVLPDFGDTADSQRSLLTQVFGFSDALFQASFTIAGVAAVVAVIAWVGLFVSLLHGHRART